MGSHNRGTHTHPSGAFASTYQGAIRFKGDSVSGSDFAQLITTHVAGRDVHRRARSSAPSLTAGQALSTISNPT